MSNHGGIPQYSKFSVTKKCPTVHLNFQVKEVMKAGVWHDKNVLHWAAASGCMEIFEATMRALRNRMTQAEVGRGVQYL